MYSTLSVLYYRANPKSCVFQFSSKLTCYTKLHTVATQLQKLNTLEKTLTRGGYLARAQQQLQHQKYNCITNADYCSKVNYGTFGRTGDVTNFLSKQEVKDFCRRLTPEEHAILIAELQNYQSQTVKAKYEGQLATYRWRSKFGRPSSVPSLGEVDPTGTYCAVPDDWLMKKYAETVPPPTRHNLIVVFCYNAIPFIGFGFLDNSIMILAGEHIDMWLGSCMTLSKMAAAALGNTISDVIGIGSATYVERLAVKMGLTHMKLTPVQLQLPESRHAAYAGRVVGIIIGCLLGMIPLLFIS